MIQPTIFDAMASSLAAERNRERVLASTGAAGCRAHRKRLEDLTAEQLRLELAAHPICTANGWRHGSMAR